MVLEAKMRQLRSICFVCCRCHSMQLKYQHPPKRCYQNQKKAVISLDHIVQTCFEIVKGFIFPFEWNNFHVFEIKSYSVFHGRVIFELPSKFLTLAMMSFLFFCFPWKEITECLLVLSING